MASTKRVVKTIVGMVGIMGLGFGLWAAVTPNEAQMKKLAKELPRSSPQQRAERKHLNEQVMEILKEAAETNENVARRTWPWKK
ncbi:ubiquinol-cytochrome-c reductase complex assembly factor 3 [Sphaerodactylus townsendi]|uniref:Uncharacterized protein n=1 Tax=Sphaerodactylus townsendi TaxID=933632 RepID=A0ACB8G8Z8_9SAUR|nr:ubiquinol-cytochrome-c reductase complex assembly factor 3 [Sphaerodactylus townsendi]